MGLSIVLWKKLICNTWEANLTVERKCSVLVGNVVPFWLPEETCVN